MDQHKKMTDSDESTPTERISESIQKLKEFKEMYLSQELKLEIDIEILIETKRKLRSDTELLSKQIHFFHKHKSTKIEFLRREKLDLERDVKLLNRQKVGLGTDLDSLKVEKAIINREKLRTIRDIESLNKEKKELGSHTELLDHEKTVLRSDIELLNKEKAKLGSDTKLLDKERIRMGSVIESLNNEKTAINVEKTRLLCEKNGVVSDICLLRKKKNVLESDIESEENKKSELKRELESFNEEKEKLQSDLESLKQEISKVGSIKNNLIQQPKPTQGQGVIIGNIPTRAQLDVNLPRDDCLYSKESQEKSDSRSIRVTEDVSTCLNKEDSWYLNMPQSTGKKRRYYQVVDETHHYSMKIHGAKMNTTQMHPVLNGSDLLDTIAVFFPKKRRTQKGRNTLFKKRTKKCQSTLLKYGQSSIQINDASCKNIMNGQHNAVGVRFGNLPYSRLLPNLEKLQSNLDILNIEKTSSSCASSSCSCKAGI